MEISADKKQPNSHFQLLMGSVAEKVLHHSTIPLFIIPTKEHKSK